MKRLKKLSEDGKTRARALEWVMNRPRSGREFKQYMYRKKADPDLAVRLQEEFETRGYLSDMNYAAWLIDMRRRGGKSERAIRSELLSKGVNREVLQDAASDNGNEIERLRELVAKKRELGRYKADPQKFIQFLARKGFNFDDIKAVLAEEKGSGS